MKLTVFAATGRIGGQVLDQALAAGHDVTAVARNPAALSGPVRAVAADLGTVDRADLLPAVAGADAVLSGLGPRSRADAGIASVGTRAIVQAMRATGVRRIVAVSAAPVATVASPGRPNPPRHDPGDGFPHAPPGRPGARGRPARRLRRPGAHGGRPAGQRPGLDRGAAAAPDRPAPDRDLPDRHRAEPPARTPDRAGRRRPPHARHARPTRDHRPGRWASPVSRGHRLPGRGHARPGAAVVPGRLRVGGGDRQQGGAGEAGQNGEGGEERGHQDLGQVR